MVDISYLDKTGHLALGYIEPTFLPLNPLFFSSLDFILTWNQDQSREIYFF